MQPEDTLGLDPIKLSRITNWMNAHVHDGRLSGLAVQISRRGKICFSERAGFADAKSKRPVLPDTIWRIYSMTKPVTSLALLMLYEEGAFQLDQPVCDFLPGFSNPQVWKGPGHALNETEPADRGITIHDLLTHQAGIVYGDPQGNELERALSDSGLDFDRGLTTMAEAVEVLASFPLAFQPGDRWFYGLSTDVLGHLIEVISGQTLGEFLKTRIFDPLGMVDTGFAVSADKSGRLATLYDRAPGGFVASDDQQGFIAPVTLESGGGGLLSTMDDYQRFATMLLRRGRCDGGRLLGRKAFDLMVCNHMGGDLASRGQAHFSETTFEGVGFGLGVSVMLDPARAKIIGSPGEFAWGGMASTAFWVDPIEEMTVILMTQLIPSSAYTLRRELRVLSYQALVD
ncbi:serine hydrolase [Ruegeria sp. HKCCA5763]|uniref:serine hydrolase domain-containing protein n=1 Tax=Ruegeria sp. HKCCA5763 TaxID=2682987 RepID=UPI0020C1EE17|nr:serine hydrolase domain-containing protein [Ruegeria sp. HKCCA5763]